MATLPDLLFVVLFALVWPLHDYFVFWPALQHWLQAEPARARTRFWTGATTYPWTLVAIGAALGVENGRSWTLTWMFDVSTPLRLAAELTQVVGDRADTPEPDGRSVTVEARWKF